MLYLIKFIFYLLISHYSFANAETSNQILFKLNNTFFTNIDLEKRKEYVALLNNFKQSKFSEEENNKIYEDYVSSLIFYEYYIQNKISFKKLNDEVELIYKKNLQSLEELNQVEIKKFKFNTKIDLVRNKIIQKKLNSKKESLLQDANKLDLLYNYNMQYIIVKESLIDKQLVNSIDDRTKFEDLKNLLIKKEIKFFYKEEDIDDNTILSKKIKNIINQNIQIYINKENEYINLISIRKNLESYEGIFVKLINFKSNKPFEKLNLQCDKLNETVDINKTVFREYEYTKLNNNIKNNLKSINDYILFKNDDEYNYIVLCDITYDEKLLKSINFNKNVNSLVKKIERNFIKKYKNEYKFIKIK